MRTRYVYIHNLAKNIAGNLGINPKDFTPDGSLPAVLFKKYYGDVLNALSRFSDEAKGKIVSCARPHDEDWRTTSLYDVFQEELDLKEEGYVIMSILAAGTIIAAIADNVYKAHGIRPSVGSRLPVRASV